MGGWYDTNGFVPGHSLGQYISGLARIGAATGDEACHAKVRDLVTGFAATLGPDNQSIIRPKTNLWTCYTLDKHFAGLIDALTLSNVQESRDLLNRVLAGSQPLLPAKGRDRIGKKDPPYDETFVMPENLFTAAELTDNPAFTELAHRYLLDKELFNPLAAGDDPFPGQHAYSHAIALSSGAKAFLTLGDARYKAALINAHRLLTTQQQFASGGWGPNETFITPHRGELYNSLSTTVDHFETPCGAYAATKLARYLLRFTGDPQYGDNLERVLYNTILAAKMPNNDGDYPYYSTYSPSAKKVYYQRKWPCCSGTLVQTVADNPLNLYFQSPTGLYVNLYTPSEVKWKHNNVAVTLTQQTDYPTSESISFVVTPAKPATFALNFRIPAWTKDATLNINGKRENIKLQPGTFVTIQRHWKAGDKIDRTIPQTCRTESIDDKHSDTVAFMRGPVQYVALSTGASKSIRTFNGLPTINSKNWRPLYAIQTETYDTYFNT